MKEQFELYRKWFKTLLVKEFLNLNFKDQEHFLIIADKFLKDCRKVHNEAKSISERTTKITVTEILCPDNKTENYIIIGHGSITGQQSTIEQIKISYPTTLKKPHIGDVITHTIYSLDNISWYSSKEELITGRASK